MPEQSVMTDLPFPGHDSVRWPQEGGKLSRQMQPESDLNRFCRAPSRGISTDQGATRALPRPSEQVAGEGRRLNSEKSSSSDRVHQQRICTRRYPRSSNSLNCLNSSRPSVRRRGTAIAPTSPGRAHRGRREERRRPRAIPNSPPAVVPRRGSTPDC